MLLSGLFLVFFWSTACPAADIAVVSNAELKVYNTLFEGFSSALGRSVAIERIDPKNIHSLVDHTGKSRPKLIMTIGYDALMAVRDIKGFPIISTMVLNPRSILPGDTASSGVSLIVSFEKQMDALKRILPKAKKVGVLYNPAEMGHLMKRAQDAAGGRGLELLSREAGNPSEALSAIASLKGEADVIWLLPDITVIDYDFIKYLFLFSHENRVPVFAFSEKYVRNSALMALEMDPFDIGTQAGEIAAKVLAGEDINSIPFSFARKGDLFINARIAEKFGMAIDIDSLKKDATIIRENGR